MCNDFGFRFFIILEIVCVCWGRVILSVIFYMLWYSLVVREGSVFWGILGWGCGKVWLRNGRILRFIGRAG